MSSGALSHAWRAVVAVAVGGAIGLGLASSASALPAPTTPPRVSRQTARTVQLHARIVHLRRRVVDVAPKRHASARTVGSDVLFAFDSARLGAAAHAVLAPLVREIRSAPRGVIVVTGYTDDIGTRAYNLGLSRRRAAAVVADLKKQLGTRGHSLRAVGRGKSDPVASNGTSLGRQRNRRVTVRVPR